MMALLTGRTDKMEKKQFKFQNVEVWLFPTLNITATRMCMTFRAT